MKRLSRGRTEFGVPDFSESEFEKPAYIGNDFGEDNTATEERVIEKEEKETEELSGFEKALREFEREQLEERIEPEVKEPTIKEPEIKEPAFEETPTPLVPQRPKYSIPEEMKDELAEFLLISGMEEQICNTIGNIIERKRNGDPTGGHLIMTGDAKSGKTYLTISIIKAVGKEIGSSTGRVAKVQAEALNGKDLKKVFSKIEGSDLIIENAGYLNDETVKRLISAMKTANLRSMVVLEGNELGVDNIIAKHPELKDLFRTRLKLHELSLSDWGKFACNYAQEKGYIVGDMAVLALHARIDEINLPTTRLVAEDVQGIIDKAIDKAKKRSSGRLFGGKKNRDSVQELDETDFM